MANIMTIKVIKDEWKPLIKTLGSRKVGKALGNAGNRVSHRIKKNLVNEIERQGLTWKGRLKNSVQVKRKGNINQITMVNYGIMLDSMRTHFVSLKRGRKITAWYNDKIGMIPRPRALRVRKHPFINRPIAQGLRNK